MRYRVLMVIGVLACDVSAVGAWAVSEATVRIDNFSFGPGQIIVARGTRVTWANQDDIPHTVTDAAGQREFKSPPLDSGEHFDHVFSNPGVYHYFCSLHPKMQGVIVVK